MKKTTRNNNNKVRRRRKAKRPRNTFKKNHRGNFPQPKKGDVYKGKKNT